jgi:hypothetical protein
VTVDYVLKFRGTRPDPCNVGDRVRVEMEAVVGAIRGELLDITQLGSGPNAQVVLGEVTVELYAAGGVVVVAL